MKLIELADDPKLESSYFYEGMVLAANMAVKPTQPESWLPEVLPDADSQLHTQIVEQIHTQYAALKANHYSVSELLENDVELAEFAEGFMALWPVIEQQWQEQSPSDGTMRMLHAWLTSLMLIIDTEQTHAQMKQAGFEQLPQLDDFLPQLDMMINEIAMAADEMMQGHQSQTVNPYKQIGRNDTCPCGSGVKFKKCCGQNR
ncbi:YecA family protein [Vibrio hippocampi]|uniref:Prepilin peptidase n=1 Tax=Vibrio hippocampi TaxID=654686 RepID=A0ABN8DHJ9_9VIBR|nr:YecA family protein [Vibrio hippocampi]CAH0525376.1 hypothetical protein VHP8226_00944 [Vibrio hippocampi]